MTTGLPGTRRIQKLIEFVVRVVLILVASWLGPAGLFGVIWTEGKQWQSYVAVAVAVVLFWLGVRRLPLRRPKEAQEPRDTGANL